MKTHLLIFLKWQKLVFINRLKKRNEWISFILFLTLFIILIFPIFISSFDQSQPEIENLSSLFTIIFLALTFLMLIHGIQDSQFKESGLGKFRYLPIPLSTVYILEWLSRFLQIQSLFNISLFLSVGLLFTAVLSPLLLIYILLLWLIFYLIAVRWISQGIHLIPFLGRYSHIISASIFLLVYTLAQLNKTYPEIGTFYSLVKELWVSRFFVHALVEPSDVANLIGLSLFISLLLFLDFRLFLSERKLHASVQKSRTGKISQFLSRVIISSKSIWLGITFRHKQLGLILIILPLMLWVMMRDNTTTFFQSPNDILDSTGRSGIVALIFILFSNPFGLIPNFSQRILVRPIILKKTFDQFHYFVFIVFSLFYFLIYGHELFNNYHSYYFPAILLKTVFVLSLGWFISCSSGWIAKSNVFPYPKTTSIFQRQKQQNGGQIGYTIGLLTVVPLSTFFLMFMVTYGSDIMIYFGYVISITLIFLGFWIKSITYQKMYESREQIMSKLKGL